MPSQYPIRAVAKLTGIPVDTLRAWERRYQAVRPGRTERGRLYGESDVRRLILLRNVVEQGHAIGQVASLSDEELQKLSGNSVRADAAIRHHTGRAVGDATPELETLLQAIESFDHTGVNSELGRLSLLLNSRDIVHRVVLPLMHAAGERWEKGALQIAHEHMLSACVRNLLGGLLRLQDNRSNAPGILLTTPIGELHEFGILAAALLATAQQFEVSYLGPSLPAREILFASAKNEPRVVVLAITQVNATAAVRDEVRQLALELPPHIELWLGGDGAAEVFHDRLREGFVLLPDLLEFEKNLQRVRSLEHVR